jgi:hypothetical protein
MGETHNRCCSLDLGEIPTIVQLVNEDDLMDASYLFILGLVTNAVSSSDFSVK